MEGLGEEEISVAKQLKKLCVPVKGMNKQRELDITKTTPLLHRLGRLYRTKSPDKFSLVRSAGLLNAALLRQPANTEIKNDLFELCNHVLKLANAKKKGANLLEISQEIAVKINWMRQKVTQVLDSLENITDEQEKNKERKTEIMRVAEIRSLQEMVTKDYTAIMDSISHKCVGIMGTAPCRFTHVGMGSLAKKEVTPYSDFESIVVLEEGVQNNELEYTKMLDYFRWYSVLFLIIMINLKETLLRFLAIPSLNSDSESGSDWFYDEFTPSGICPDGLAAHACKNPLGRQEVTKQKPFTTELIKPVSEMAKYLGNEEELKNGYYLWDLLTKTCFVSGDGQVYNEFVCQIKCILQTHQDKIHQLAFKQLKENYKNFEVLSQLNMVASNNTFDVKRVVYRCTTIFLSAIGRLFSLDDCSCFDIIERIHEMGLISEDTAHQLLYAVAIACQVRLKVYRSRRSQSDMVGDDTVYEYGRALAIRDVLEVVGIKSTCDYFVTAYMLQEALRTALEETGASPGSKRGFISKVDTYLAKSKLSFRLRILYRLGLNDNLINEWEEYQLRSVQNNQPIEEEQLAEELSMRISLAQAYFDRKEYGKCSKQCKYVVNHNVRPLNTLTLVTMMMGRCCNEVGEFEEGMKFFNEATRVITEYDEDSEENYKRLGELCYHVGVCNMGMNKYHEALSSFRDRLRCPLHILYRANCLKNVGVCLVSLKKFDQAIGWLRRALSISQAKGSVTLVCLCLYNMGCCYHTKGKYKKALQYYIPELRLREIYVPEKQLDVDKDIIRVKAGICDCETKLKKQNFDL
ncbi:unnamed protein product [Clavelina lepadiformis]|uniref:Uncharacterized protein n=1 Tax=Clavelina lepadiformis TaxID=159417 RepID=A0ABP0GTB1_CLALP